MKRLIKFILATTLTASLVTAAAASGGHYGMPAKKAAGKLGDSISGYVTLYNLTNSTYNVTATFYSSQTQSFLPIYPANDPRSIITYDISYPDTQVCISVGGSAPTCTPGGLPTKNLYIRYGTAAKSAPIITAG
ncbi:MAG TPA: hypothetical protein VLI69_01055 [Gammaproteobacteria bacterium]|nr:hypothetical protein [Gammaproteobacteria bacterium]